VERVGLLGSHGLRELIGRAGDDELGLKLTVFGVAGKLDWMFEADMTVGSFGEKRVFFLI
jgi:hypothetical protein